MDGKLILSFRVWTGAAYEWSRAWTDHLAENPVDLLSLKLDDSGQGYGGFYPDVATIRLKNENRFWDRLTKTAPLLAAGTDPYRTGFRGRLVRLTEVTSGTERILFTGAVDGLKISSQGGAELSIVGLQRLAMDQKADAAKVDDATAYGEWVAAPGALYRDRTAIGNGGYDADCYRHKRVKACFERTKMARMDASVVVENIKLSTFDSRRTVTAVSLPEGVSFQGFVWGAPSGELAYAVGTVTGSASLYEFNYATGEVRLLVGLLGNLGEVAWCGLFYSADAGTGGAVGIPIWDTVTGYPWLKVFDLATETLSESIRMDLFAATLPASGSIGATLLFDEFLFWAPGRANGGVRGTLWFLVDSYDYGVTAGKVDNRLVEIDPWSFLTWPAILNDSLNAYAGMLRAIWPAACGDASAMNPIPAAVAPGDITIYIFANLTGAPLGNYHTNIFKMVLSGGSWLAASMVHSYSGITRFGCLAETPVGLLFTRSLSSIAQEQIVSKVFADFGSNSIFTVRETEYWPGTQGYTTVHPYAGPQFVYNYEDDRIYYGTGNVISATNWNTRLRSIDATSNTTAARDENVNPAGASVGDPPTDQANSMQVGTALRVRYQTAWELHGVLVSPLESDVVMSYSSSYYPCVPLFDVRGKTLWEVRRQLAAACNAYFAYDGEGNLRLFARAGATLINPWPTEEPTVDSLGLTEVVNRLSAIPYRVTTASDSREAEVISQAVGTGSTGVVVNIKTGRVATTRTFRIVFTSCAPGGGGVGGRFDYSVDELIAGLWTNLGAGEISTPFIYTAFTLSPDCFAGNFVNGDTFTFVTYCLLATLEQQAAYNKIEVADTASETLWGRTERGLDFPFLPRAQTIDVLTKILTWTSRPHRQFTIGVEAYRYVGLLEQRSLVSARETYAAMAVGWTRKFSKSPRKRLTLLEA